MTRPCSRIFLDTGCRLSEITNREAGRRRPQGHQTVTVRGRETGSVQRSLERRRTRPLTDTYGSWSGNGLRGPQTPMGGSG